MFSQRCVDALEQFDFNFQNLLDEQVFNNLVKEFYSHHVKLVLQNKDSISDIKRRELAFLYSEKSRAQLLGKLIKRTQLLNEFDSTNSLMSEDAALKNKLSNLINQRLEELQKEKIDSSELYRINGKIADVKISLASIENSFKELKDLDLESDRLMPQPIETIRASLMPYQSIIKFFKLKDRLLVFLISQQDCEFFDLNDKHLESKINTVNEAIQSKDYETFLSSSNAVYEQLLKPIEHHIQGTELIIIPDEYLWNLNFGLLIKQSTEFTSTPKYLLYDYAISYANSASIFYNYTEHRDEVDKTETLGFAYTPVSIADGMDSVRPINQQTALPGTETELRALSEFLKGDFYFRNPSNESTFKKEASNYGLIHLALHAEADSLKSNDLKILFSGQQKTNEEDNILYGHEIYNMRLNANMVVLSACNSGIGKIDNGEGVQSLGNAFQHAGTQSLVLTKWNISDKSTPTLIENFYKHLKTGKSKSKALQEAKIDFLSSASVLELNPYYWGSFYVLGDPSAITVATKNAFKTRYLFMLFFLVIIFLVFFNSFKR